MYCAIIEREEEADNTVQIPTNHGSAGYVEYIKGEKGCDVTDPLQIKLPSIPDDWKAKKSNTTYKRVQLENWYYATFFKIRFFAYYHSVNDNDSIDVSDLY